jgi:hypothetical protein
MNQTVFHQIQYLCKNIPKVEWSGALFYTTEGSIDKPETFKIILKTILPLDMGTAGYTEYNLDERFIDFIEEDFEERCTWKLGHIHSHNVMRVFFSGVDMGELNDNAPSHNFYLSLIVNNYMDFMAKVAFIGEAYKEIPNVSYFAMDSSGKKYVIQKQNFEVKTQKLFTYDCEIISPKTEIVVEDIFAERVAKIMEPKPVKAVHNVFPVRTNLQIPTKGNPKQLGYNKFKKTQEQREMESWNASFDPKNVFDEDSWKIDPDIPLHQVLEEEEIEDLEAQEQQLEIDVFVTNLFNFKNVALIGDQASNYYSMLNALAGLSPFDIAQKVISNYMTLYNDFYPDGDKDHFILFTEWILDVLEEEAQSYPEILKTKEVLGETLDKFIKDEYRTKTEV